MQITVNKFELTRRNSRQPFLLNTAVLFYNNTQTQYNTNNLLYHTQCLSVGRSEPRAVTGGTGQN